MLSAQRFNGYCAVRHFMKTCLFSVLRCLLTSVLICFYICKKMVFKCCIPKCRGNYDAENKVHVFAFPKDEVLAAAWIKAIPRENLVVNSNTKVCEKHFRVGDIEWESTGIDTKTGAIISVPLKRPRLRSEAVPCIFPGCPQYLTCTRASIPLRPSPHEKRVLREANILQKAMAASLQDKLEYDAQSKFKNLSEMKYCIKNLHLSSIWNIIEKHDMVIFIFGDFTVMSSPSYFTIDDSLCPSVFLKGVPLYKSLSKIPNHVSSLEDIECVTSFIEKMENKSSAFEDICHVLIKLLEQAVAANENFNLMFTFLIAQIKLVMNNKNCYRYDPEFLVFATIVHLISPCCYRFIRNSLQFILPSETTIRKLISTYGVDPHLEQFEEHFLKYAKERFSGLQDKDKIVILMLDEIHIKQFMDYKAGNIVGASFDGSGPANSAHVFMIQSVFSTYKDVIHILPVATMTSDALHTVTKKVIVGLENIGFQVIAVITDNNSINRKAMSFFCLSKKLSCVYPHPVASSRPLFYLIDSVHILKCVRNNWLNQKSFGTTLVFPAFDRNEDLSASFSCVRQLYKVECERLLKYSYHLTAKALWPGPLERQNVKLVLQVFNDLTIQGLIELGSTENIVDSKGTAEFITIVLNWWRIMNVKTIYKGEHLRSVMEKPLTSYSNDERLLFLEKFLTWLQVWEAKGCNLSKETFGALKQTTHGIIEMAKYCREELGAHYILPGKFQTDSLEARFGQYRQLAGANYNVSIRQIFEVEKKLRLPGLLNLGLKNRQGEEIQISPDEEFDITPSVCPIISSMFELNPEDFDRGKNDLPLIVYISGYCSRKVVKRLKCENCSQMLTVDRRMAENEQFRLIMRLDRGGLLYPSEFVVQAVLIIYCVVSKLILEYEKQFLKHANQKGIVITLAKEHIVKEKMNLMACNSGHSSDEILDIVFKTTTNILLNNFCKQRNDHLINKKNSKKRKLSTVSK